MNEKILELVNNVVLVITHLIVVHGTPTGVWLTPSLFPATIETQRGSEERREEAEDGGLNRCQSLSMTGARRRSPTAAAVDKLCDWVCLENVNLVINLFFLIL